MLAAEDETRYMLNQLKAIHGLWEDLCTAANDGKPQCLRRVIDIAQQAGVIENDPKRIELARNSQPSGQHPMDVDGASVTSKSFVIYSEHLAAAGEIDISNYESNILHIIIWALEGQLFLIE